MQILPRYGTKRYSKLYRVAIQKSKQERGTYASVETDYNSVASLTFLGINFVKSMALRLCGQWLSKRNIFACIYFWFCCFAKQNWCTKYTDKTTVYFAFIQGLYLLKNFISDGCRIWSNSVFSNLFPWQCRGHVVFSGIRHRSIHE